MSRPTKKPAIGIKGPKPETLKIEGDWEDAVKRALATGPRSELPERPKIPQRAPKSPAKKKAPK
jgi:hypothetical protein